MHELAHTIGLWHEMQRSDRDEHVHIRYENIGYYSAQFRKLTTHNDVEYDFSSVLHYSGKVRHPTPCISYTGSFIYNELFHKFLHIFIGWSHIWGCFWFEFNRIYQPVVPTKHGTASRVEF